MHLRAPSANGSRPDARSCSSAQMASNETDVPFRINANTASPTAFLASSSIAPAVAMSSWLINFGTLTISIVSLKGLFKGMLGSGRRWNAGHCRPIGGERVACVYAQADATPLRSRMARAVMRFEDSPLGAAFGVALLFGLIFALLHIGGAQ
jgi:hypothetical protein